MFKQLFNEQDLPMEELQKIGIAGGGVLQLQPKDLAMLLAGRRTDMLRLDNLEADGFKIPALDAKLSLRQNEAGHLDLLLHPIYRDIDIPMYLTDTEAEELESGQVVNIDKVINDKGVKKEVLIEFDPDTREFITTDTAQVLVPDMVNNEILTPAQRARYLKGKEVNLQDGTAFQFSAVDEHAIRANRVALVVSLVMDGGLSYLLLKGLNAMLHKKRDAKQAEKQSPGFKTAKELLERQGPVTGTFVKLDDDSDEKPHRFPSLRR